MKKVLFQNCFVGIIFLLFSGASFADDVEIARNLGAAINQNLTNNYMCQKYLGGTGHYRAAKLSATNIYAQVTGDRNQAVLNIDSLEQKLKNSTLLEDIEKGFEDRGIEYVDRVAACQEMIAESGDQIQVLLAKLGLL